MTMFDFDDPLAPCVCIGELGNAHNGSYENAVRLLDGLKAAGATAAKLQCYSADELVALRGDGPAPAQWSHMTMRELYTRAATPFGWFAPLYDHAARIGLPIFSSVFGPDSLALLESIGNPAYKMARLDNAQGGLAARIYETGKPLIVSAADGDDPGDIEADAWLWCEPGYPSDPRGTLPMFSARDPFQPWYGMSSHCLAPELPIAAVARGCKLIEMHIQLDDEPSALEANVSLTIMQFRDMVQAVRRTEAMIG